MSTLNGLINQDCPNRGVSRYRESSYKFSQEFSGIVASNISLDMLISTRKRLINDIVGHMNRDDKSFLLSVKRAAPDFSLLGMTHIANLPAVKWKILNIKKMHRDKQKEQYLKLERVLS